ncbi:hypothetical protein LV28_04960 [Pandoraea pnomenusa]|uniref:Beta-xylosidase n=1 Tax=Pandoraea pnomenusa TaxID=93220 RepID=A0A378YGY7_9BURK|nr:hypothetical protein [Pandoraea pnomenusa]AHN73259.2 hypothetical protein DA70_01385 [Pandoraea pnomenusa]AIU25977.1 hypothetical protein LV28_04960 [Pandoraea pnomenusa]ANC43201.1 hypothetical protein A6P55_01905 [Pandoraea pnomenusa]QDH60397.1 hypothetical protein FKQ53_14615 [Pandoraea pnomenusa]QDX22376.1 hypothetical protein FP568_14695 [Pandoraea pnomenusa]
MSPPLQRWRKLGRVFVPDGQTDWMASHAAVPIAEPLPDGNVRVYFSSRDRDNRSHTGFLVFDPEHPQRVLDIGRTPVLTPGATGEFDDSGAMATWLATWQGQRYLYYIGWNLGVTVPFRNAIGLATAPAGEHTAFQRRFAGPVVDRSMHEPHFVASCCVMPGDDVWRMWYLSCTEWRIRQGKPEHRYHIKYAESPDGVNWRRDGTIAIDYADTSEYAISRPSVIREGDVWHMWYSCRGQRYRIGYARSADGIRWTRHDGCVDLSPSPGEWDAEMIEYPHVFDHRGRRYMLFNGDGYGLTGFGLAVMESWT